MLPRGIRRRIFAAFAVLVAFVAAAAGFALVQHDEYHALLDDVAHAEEVIHASLELGGAVRDQYAHEAHTLILGNTSHHGHHAEAVARVEAALVALRRQVATETERAAVEALAETTRALRRNYDEKILPRLGGGSVALAEAHARALGLVDDALSRLDALTAPHRARVAAAPVHSHAGRWEDAGRSLLFVLAALVFAAAVGFYVDRSITEPLRRLEEGAARLATGDLATRVAEGRDDELGVLARAFNRMAEELAARQARLVETEKLAGLGRLGAGVAHEINNPLAVILGYARLLSRHPDAQVAADAGQIAAEAERCRAIVADLLDLARPARLHPGPVELVELAREVAEQLPQAGLEADCVVEGDAEVEVEGDAGRLRQIVWNLVRNAAEAAPAGTVRVTVSRDGDGALLRVTDEGPGVPAAARATLFEPFQTTKDGGTGLGLAVSAALARAHGGELTLADEPGPGACFVLRLPAQVPVAGPIHEAA